jgi:hypothetical protein
MHLPFLDAQQYGITVLWQWYLGIHLPAVSEPTLAVRTAAFAVTAFAVFCVVVFLRVSHSVHSFCSCPAPIAIKANISIAPIPIYVVFMLTSYRY